MTVVSNQNIPIHLVGSQHSFKSIYLRFISGFWGRLRKNINGVCLPLFFFVPWLSWNDRSFLGFEGSQNQIFFGPMVFYPQDFFILALFFIFLTFLLFFVTSLWGRVWCGYLCPQTVWSFLFVWIEEKCEGTRHQRMKVDQLPWSMEKFVRKLIKHGLWLLFSMLTTLTIISYFFPTKIFYSELFYGKASLSTYVIVFTLTIITYLNASFLRTVVCSQLCPYARFQSVMLDANSYVISYDTERGEPRGPRSRKDESGCIDCNLCVQVCPVGIDIRNGLQATCIQCGACIDACAHVMEKMRYGKSLIDYVKSQVAGVGSRSKKNMKAFGYGVASFFSFSLLILFIFFKASVDFSIQRDRGALYREYVDGSISNTFIVNIFNKTELKKNYTVDLENLDSYGWSGQKEFTLEAGEQVNKAVEVFVKPELLTSRVTNVEFALYSNKDKVMTAESRFIYMQ